MLRDRGNPETQLAIKCRREQPDRRHGALNVKSHKESRIHPNRLMQLIAGTQGVQFTPAGVLRLPLDGVQSSAHVLDYVSARLTDLA